MNRRTRQIAERIGDQLFTNNRPFLWQSNAARASGAMSLLMGIGSKWSEATSRRSGTELDGKSVPSSKHRAT
jgi:hypothetical protein